MGEDFYGANLDFDDFDRLLRNEDLNEEPVSIQRFVTDKKYLGLPPLSEIQLEIARHITQIFKPETLVQLMGEQEGVDYYEKYTVNEVICQLGKGCIAGNVKVYSPELGYKTASQLTLQPSTYDVVSHNGLSRTSTPFSKVGNGEIIRIVTKKGYSIDVYVNHKMMAAVGSNSENMDYWKKGVSGRRIDWCYANDLSIGDIVPIKIGLPESSNILSMSDDIAWWIGAMIGDGSYQSSLNGGKSITFTNNTPAVQDKWKKIVENYGQEWTSHFSGYGCPKFKINGKSSDNKRKFFSQVLEDFNLGYKSFESKKWNDDFMRLSDSAAANLLNGLWATDGWLSIQESSSGRSVSVCIDLTSEEVVRGIHDLLLRIGVVSKFKVQKSERNDGKHKPVYRVSILDLENAKKFLNIVGIIPGKEEICNKILDLPSIKKKSSLDENGWYWDRIESIESLGIQPYYDCSVDEDHSYIANGFINHNSGKDHVSRVSLAYISYLLHCLRDPLEYFGKASGVYIDLVNLAVNAKQAQQVFFDPLKNLLLASPWANDVGFEPRVQEIFWFDRPVRMFSGHSEAEGWEGYEVLTVVLDEISAFKALPNNSLVLTPGGYVKNGDLSVGDFVIGKNGKPTEILGVYPQGYREVFEITFDDGTTAKCSDDHIWNVYEYSDGRRKTNKNLRLKDFKSLRLNTGNSQYRYSIPLVDEVHFDLQKDDLPIDPYILGILLSEGSLRSPLGFTTGDSQIVSEIKNRTEYNIVPSHKNCKDFEWRINSGGKLEQHLKDLGLWNTKSDTKFIPEIYLRSSIENRKLLLAGLMDGDGTYARGQGSYTTISDRLKDGFVDLCRSLGGSPTSSKHRSWYKDSDGKVVECNDKWMICPRISFNPFLLDRKADKWSGHRKMLAKSIVDVKSLGYEEEMTCIMVENEDGLYVIDDYIVTHNTDIELKGQLRNKGSASEIYEMARASITSRFPSVGKVVLLSFPRFKGDFIQQRYKSVLDDLASHGKEVQDEKFGNRGAYRESHSWALKAATWEVNPTRTREEFENEFRRDPIMAKARFACEPPEMEDAYFRDPESVRKAFSFKESPQDEEGKWKSWFTGSDEHPRFIHVDLGLKRDRAALCMVHCPGFKQIKTMGGVENLPIIEMDYLQSWKAEANSEIPFAQIRATINDLARRFTVVSVTFDQWNSADMIQSLRSANINADLHTVAKKDYDTLSTAIYDGRIRGYWNEILVEEELLKLKLINNTKVDHPTTGSKDLADSVAGATFMCVSNLSSDFEIDIEILDEVDYEILESEDIEGTVKKIIGKNKKSSFEEKKIPEDIKEWLEIL